MKHRFRCVIATLLTVTTFFTTSASALEGAIESAYPEINRVVNLAMNSLAETGNVITESIELIKTNIEADAEVSALHNKDDWTTEEIYKIYKEGYALDDIGKALELAGQLNEKPYTLLQKKGKPQLQVVEKPQLATLSDESEVNSADTNMEEEFMLCYAPEKTWDTVVAEVVNDTTYNEEMQQIKEYGLDKFIDLSNFTDDELDYLDFQLNSGISTMSISGNVSDRIIDVYNNIVFPQSKYSQYNTNLIKGNNDEIVLNELTQNYTIKTTDLSLKGKNGLDLNLTRVNSLSNTEVDTPYVMISQLEHETETKHYYSVTGYADVTVKYREPLPDGSYTKTFDSQEIVIRPLNQGDTVYEIASITALENDRARLDDGRAPISMFDSYSKAQAAAQKAMNGDYNRRYVLGDYGNVLYVEFNVMDHEDIIVVNDEGTHTITQEYTGADIFCTTYDNISLTKKYFDIGVGWEFDFPYIEYIYCPYDGVQRDAKYLHYGDKGVWRMDGNYLDGYHLDDITISDGSTFNGERCKDILTEKDGKKYYFGQYGQLLGIEDRFGNTIKFEYNTKQILGDTYPSQLTKIIDSVGREIVFDYSNSLQTIITVIDKNDNTQNRVLTYNKTLCEGRTDDYLLSSVVDFEGNQTSYTYAKETLKKSLTSKTFADNDFEDIIHFPITGIHKPTGTFVEFIVNKRLGNFGSDGLAYRLQCDSYEISDPRLDDPNKQRRTYCKSVKYPSSTQSDYKSAIQYDGYPRFRNMEEIPTEIKIGAISTEDFFLGADEIYTNNVYSKSSDERDWLCTEKTTVREGDSNIAPLYRERIDYTYNNRNQCTKETIKKFNDPSNQGLYQDNHQDIPIEYTYDRYNNLLKIKPYGDENYATTYTYDSTYHLPTQVTYKKDANTTITESYTLTDDKKSVAVATASENGVTKRKRGYVYDSFGNVVTEKRYTGNNSWQEYIPIQYSYDDLSENTNKINGANLNKISVTGIKDADGETVDTIEHQYIYDWFGNIKTEIDQNGNVFSYTYDDLNRPIMMTNPSQGTISLSYGVGLVNNYVQITDENQKVFKYTYNSVGKLIEEKDVSTGTVLRTYADDDYREEESGKDISKTDVIEYSNNGNTIKTSTVSTFCDGVIFVEKTDEDGNVLYREDYDYEYAVDNTYDTVTKTVKGETADKDYIIKQYIDKYGNVFKEEVTYKNGNATETFTTEYTYDFLGNVTSVTNPRASAEDWSGETRTARYEYDIDGQVTKMTDIYGNYTINEYDGLGRLVRTADAESTATSSPYYTTFTYDGLGRLLETQTPISGNMYSQIKNYYDGNGNITSQKVKNGTNDYSVTTTQYNWRNQPTKILTDGTDTAYQYDAVGNLIKHYTGELANLTDNYTGADYKLTQYTYDNRGNVTSETDSLGKTAYHTYDINGNLTKTVDRNGKTINYVYDPLKNLIKKSGQKGGTEEDVYTYSYNPQGLLLSMTGGGVDSAYTYDNLGRLIREELTNGVVKQYNYDEHGNRTSFILTKDNTEQMNVTYSYDKLDRLQSMTANGVTTTYTYDRNGRLLTNNSGDFNTAYTYNLGGMVTGLTTQNGDTAIQSHSYTYLPNGNISGKQSTVGTQTTNYAYQYDKAGRLTNETINSASTAYTYDAWSNRASMTGNGTSSTYTYDANNRLTKSITEQGSTKTTANYYYDHNGNNISKTVMTNAPKNENAIGRIFLSANTDENVALYEYNSYNQLVKVDTDGKVTTYAYDGSNLRQSKTTNGVTTQHIWDGSNMVMDGTNKFYRGATGIEFATLRGNTSFYHKDAHGDVTALTDNEGTITQSYIYDAFGNQINENENDINPFRYCGEYLDSETGLTYLRNRYYDNSIGRFITEDPIRDGLNWYVYCNSNPINFTDGWGLDPALDEYIRNNYSGKMTVTLAVARPVPNSREVARITSDGTLDNGHSFLRLDDGNGNVKYLGLAPTEKSLKKMLLAEDVGGKMVNDANSPWNVAKVYTINEEQYNLLLSFMTESETNTPNYNIESYNCTTWAVAGLKKAGINSYVIGTYEHNWKLPADISSQLDSYSAKPGWLPSWLGSATVKLLMGGFHGYTPADAAQDLKSAEGTTLLQYDSTGVKTIQNTRYWSAGR